MSTSYPCKTSMIWTWMDKKKPLIFYFWKELFKVVWNMVWVCKTPAAIAGRQGVMKSSTWREARWYTERERIVGIHYVWRSHIHTHFTPWFASCTVVREETGILLLSLALDQHHESGPVFRHRPPGPMPKNGVLGYRQLEEAPKRKKKHSAPDLLFKVCHLCTPYFVEK